MLPFLYHKKVEFFSIFTVTLLPIPITFIIICKMFYINIYLLFYLYIGQIASVQETRRFATVSHISPRWLCQTTKMASQDRPPFSSPARPPNEYLNLPPLHSPFPRTLCHFTSPALSLSHLLQRRRSSSDSIYL